MVSQFISSHAVELLGKLDYDFPPGIHAIGRLDQHSEGLLLLSTNKKITRLLFSSQKPHVRVYLVQVNNHLHTSDLDSLQNGIPIRIKNGEYYQARCQVELVEDPLLLYPFAGDKPVFGNHSWLKMSLTEGKFHQVRKMIAATRHRCKRLIRISMEDLHLGGLAPGYVRELEEADFFRLLHLADPDNR